jgi:hypothetical protein
LFKGWVTRRKEEKAKTIAQIHKEVAKEEAQAAPRSGSSNNMHRRRNNNCDNLNRSLQRSGSVDVCNLQQQGSSSNSSQPLWTKMALSKYPKAWDVPTLSPVVSRKVL